jgi:hypothetical protein
MYKVYDSTCYGYGEPLVPFTLIGNFSKLNEVIEFLNNNKNNEIKYFVFDENNNEIEI